MQNKLGESEDVKERKGRSVLIFTLDLNMKQITNL